MRNIRKVAVSSLTALAIATGSAAVAVADEAPQCTKQMVESAVGNPDCTTRSLLTDLSDRQNSSDMSVWGKRYNAESPVTGRNLLGWEKNFGATPVWAEIWYVVTVLGVIGSAVGLITLPALNQAKALGILR